MRVLQTEDLSQLLAPMLKFDIKKLKRQTQTLVEISRGVFVTCRFYGARCKEEEFRKNPAPTLQKLADDLNHDNALTPFDYYLGICIGMMMDNGEYVVVSYMTSSKDTPV